MLPKAQVESFQKSFTENNCLQNLLCWITIGDGRANTALHIGSQKEASNGLTPGIHGGNEDSRPINNHNGSGAAADAVGGTGTEQ